MEHLELIDALLDLAFREDVYTGDVTTEAIIPKEAVAVAELTMKADGIISGLAVGELVFRRLQKDILYMPLVKDGDRVSRGDKVLRIEGRYNALLSGERIALNIMQRMSGIATATNRYVALLKGSSTQLLDTRKTAPGMRVLDKMAVKDGGGTNHRMGLYDMVLLKDNHIKAAGGILPAVEAVRAHHLPEGMKVEVETTNLEEVQEAVTAGADIIMLDNMSNERMAEAVKLIAGRAKTEASGNMSLERMAEVAATGVDYISVGALTHSVTALDISMNFV